MKRQDSILLKTSFKIASILIFITLTACSDSKYSKLVRSEMAKGITHDSLFLGMRLGQTRKEFFDKCWKLNKEGIIVQSQNNDFVQYNLPLNKKTKISHSSKMLFYGIFDKNNIMTGMNLKFFYDGWSLWNKELQSDELVPVVKELLLSWFPGNDFIKVTTQNKETLFVKVDANRRIIIKPLDDSREVKAKIEDLRYVLEE